jgi:plastocyanin
MKILKMPLLLLTIPMSVDKKKRNAQIFYAGSSVISAVTILMVAGVAGFALLTPNQVIASIDNTIEEEERVAVGGGNLTVSVNQFLPSSVEIQRGESVTFYAPQNSTEVHNVIFDLSNGSIISSLELPFVLPEGSSPDQLELAPPFNFGDPIITEQSPGGEEAIIALNKAAFYPTVADIENNTRYLIDVEELQQLSEDATQQGLFEPLNLSTNYTMNGTETIVSSGIILDVSGFQAIEEEGEEATAATAANMTTTTTTNATDSAATAATVEEEVEFPPIPYPILDSFTVTFEEPGTYEYFCAFHPGMWGVITVAGEEEVAGEEGEVSAANMTTTTTTNATDSNATAVITTPIPPTEVRPENATTPTDGGEEGEEEE